VNQKSVSWVTWCRHSQLLAGPLGGRLVRQIPVDDPSTPHPQYNEDVQQLESQRDRDEKSQASTPRARFWMNVRQVCDRARLPPP
jgi:hypothetical protein